jgi:hypothetical protein
VALQPAEVKLLTELANKLQNAAPTDDLMDAYYEGQQRLEHIGIAVPPELRKFETIVNIPRIYVDSLADRINLKSLMLPGTDVADKSLMEGWEANNLDSEFNLTVLDKFVYGRGFMCVGTNEEDKEHPLITVESPREMICQINTRTRRVEAALRLYGAPEDDRTNPQSATLYLPNETIWLSKSTTGADIGKWVESHERDRHNLGRVPVVPFINRRRSGRWSGVSQMNDVIHLTDAAARSLTNLQIAGETHAVPDKWAVGVSKGDFADKDGKLLPVWEAYFTSLKATANPDAKFGQFTASSLSNFHETVNHYMNLAAAVTGLPMRYFGQNTANPPSADGIRADESRIIKAAENHCRYLGDDIGRVFALYMRFRDGVWPDGSLIKAEWYNPATPTVAAIGDYVMKMHTEGILSREGSWDELGWSEARKQREREYFEREAIDPLLARVTREVDTRPLTPQEPVGGDASGPVVGG